MGDKETAKQLLDANDLMGAGKVLGIEPVMRARGHAFDESADSYRRRLLAECIGAVAAGAIVREEEPMDPDDDGYPQESEGAEPKQEAANEPGQAPADTPAPDAPVVATPVEKNPDQAATEPPTEGDGVKANDPGAPPVEGSTEGQPGDPNVPPTEQLP